MKKIIFSVIKFLNGFRKFTVMMTLISIGCIFRLSGHLNGSEFVELLRYTAVAYMAANTLEHMAKAVHEWAKNKLRGNK